MNEFEDVRSFRGHELQSCDTLFDSAIDRDPWVQYHATSSVNEGKIDAQGLKWTANTCSAAEIRDVVRVFRSMNWYGEHTGGYVVLDAFSLQGDFQGEESKPIYLREFSLRSLIYAERDFAGGESARAVRYAMRDLDKFIVDKSIRDKHYQCQRQQAIDLASSGAVPNRVVRVDLAWLKDQIEKLKPVRERCEALEQAHKYGVVYAVRFTRDDISSLNFSLRMGLRCYRHIPREKIVAKVRVYTDDVELRPGNDVRLVAENRWREEDPYGLIAVLAKAERDGQAYPSPTPEKAFAHRRANLLDSSAGTDDSEEIARIHGSPALAEYVREHSTR